MSLLKIININDPGSGSRFGGDDLDTINRLLSGEDLGKLLKIENILYMGGAQKLRILRPNGTNWIAFNTEAETNNWAILVPPLTADQRLLFEALDQPITNKTIDFENNTGQNIPTTAISDLAITTAKIANANVTEGKLAAGAVTNSILGANAVTDAKINDVAFTKITGQIAMSQITDNSITNTKLQQITDKAKLHSNIVYTTDNQSLTTKSMSAKTSTFEYLRKHQSVEGYGDVSLSTSTIEGSGKFTGIQYYGDLFSGDNDSTGYWLRLTSKAAAGEFAGLAHIADVLASFRRDKSGWITGKQQTFATDHPWTNQRFVFGFWDQRTTPPDSNDLIASNQNGFMIVFRSGLDTNYRVLHNDATAAAVDVDTGLAFPTSSTTHEYEVRLGASAIDWFIRNAVSGSVLASGSINTRIPSLTQKLYFYFGVIGNTKSILLRNAECKTGGH